MVLTDQDRTFLKRRRTAARVLPAGALVCILAWLALWAYLLLTQPLLTNPLYFVVHPATASEHGLETLAALAPVAVSGLFLAVLAFLLIILGLLLEQRWLVRLAEAMDAPARERESSSP